MLDEVERGLLQALQIDGRVAFSLVGAVLGVSDQTVARRYARLRAEMGVRVLGAVWPEAVGRQLWLVRVRCAPEAVAGLARALAKQAETSWVQIASGGAEIVCMAQAADAPAGEAGVLSRLPRTPRVTDVSAHCVLHTFFGGSESPLTRNGPLTAEQCAQLRPPRAERPADPEELSPQDNLLLDALALDGRAGFRSLAAVTGWSQTTVRRRLAELRAGGVAYFDVDVDPALLGLRTSAGVWLKIAPGELVAAGEALAQHPQVSFAAATTGVSNLYASVQCPSSAALYAYLTGPVAALPGLMSVETAPSTRVVKQASPIVG
ncbi:Lrp/AsnC family transcriptional regulator [Streptomyces sp. MMG1121]|uniref:Lrp/AsnC family transcriptional regulator n=1 Tax=Streptomyces sp. MMG1121 TaxID=1415544 RepID=UPI0006AE5309|nr:Lrp/AsnC family transcriptional regulator [Streptomyces sp. MMG1121]KOV61257.1 AsnC family transcriptional regulator [Streptomyces sp. MMG1121]